LEDLTSDRKQADKKAVIKCDLDRAATAQAQRLRFAYSSLNGGCLDINAK